VVHDQIGIKVGGTSEATFTRAKSNPAVVVQTVITLGDRTDEGRILIGLAPAWLEIVRLIEHDPEEMFRIPPQKWEEIIAGCYKRAGFDEVTLTPRSGDHGRDVIAVKKDFGSIRFIDQVKAYKAGHLVTANEVRSLGFCLQADPKATKGFVTTTSAFAPRIYLDPFISSLVPTRLDLVDGTRLLAWLSELARTPGSTMR
jgi:restriction system protein